MINNRQVGRRRGRGGQRPGGTPGRPDNGNRIDNRSRGNAAQLLEKYKSLASDAQRSGDRVNTEYYLQFADHYFRVLSETRSRYEENRRPNDEDGDDEFGYEGDFGNQASGNQANGSYDDRPERSERSERSERQDMRSERQDMRDTRNDRDDRPQRDDRPVRNDRDDRSQRDDRPQRAERQDRQQADRAPRQDRRPNEARPSDQPRKRDPEPRPRYANDADGDLSVAREDRPAPANDSVSPEPRRRGRPRREVAPVETDTGFDAAILPPAILPAADVAAGDNDTAEPRPRRRRVRVDKELTPPMA